MLGDSFILGLVWIVQFPLCVYILIKMLAPRKYFDLPTFTQVAIIVSAALPIIGWGLIISVWLKSFVKFVSDKLFGSEK